MTTWRDDVAVPFQGLTPLAPFTGSVVLFKAISRFLGRALQAARRALSTGSATAQPRKATTGGPGDADPATVCLDTAGSTEPAPARKSSEKSAKAKKRTKTGSADLLERVGLVIVIGLVAVATLFETVVSFLAPYAPVTLSVLGAVWLIAALAVAPPPEEDAPLNDHEKLAGEEDADSSGVEFAERRLVVLVLTAVRDAVSAGRRGVHLATLLKSIDSDWDVTTLRTHLERLEIPYRRNLNMRGIGNAYGVHIADLEAALGRSVEDALTALTHPLPERAAEGLVPGPPGGPVPAPGRAPSEPAPGGVFARLRQPAPTPSPEPAR